MGTLNPELIATVISGLGTLAGIVSAGAALATSRTDLHKLASETSRTGIDSSQTMTGLAATLSAELNTARAEIQRMRNKGCI